MNIRLKRTPGLYVVGFMASGKSTIGRALAAKLGWSFFDIDDEIERAEKTTIAAIFDRRGEAEFRRIESEIIRQHVRWIERGRPAVLAWAAALSPSTSIATCLMERPRHLAGLPVRYREAPRVATSHRPLARDPEKFTELYHAPRRLRLADFRFPSKVTTPP